MPGDSARPGAPSPGGLPRQINDLDPALLGEWRDRPVPSRARRGYTRGSMRRRRFTVRFLKFLLPAAALGLMSIIVLWPEFERTGENARLSFRRLSRAAP